MTYVMWLHTAKTEQELAQMGRKARAIAQLTQIGLPVPEGFVLLPTALTDSLKQAALSTPGHTKLNPHEFDLKTSDNQNQFQIPDHLSERVQSELEQALSILCPDGE
jgi:phosphoenolpyruvate synthase/pyruvate phosphate dikinase